jgi:hypothetical protein
LIDAEESATLFWTIGFAAYILCVGVGRPVRVDVLFLNIVLVDLDNLLD